MNELFQESTTDARGPGAMDHYDVDAALNEPSSDLLSGSTIAWPRSWFKRRQPSVALQRRSSTRRLLLVSTTVGRSSTNHDMRQ